MHSFGMRTRVLYLFWSVLDGMWQFQYIKFGYLSAWHNCPARRCERYLKRCVKMPGLIKSCPNCCADVHVRKTLCVIVDIFLQ